MAKSVSNNFIRIHLINRIIQISEYITKDFHSKVVIGIKEPFQIERTPKFVIRGLKQNGLPITKNLMGVGWYSFSNMEILSIYNQLKTENFYLTEKFDELY